MHAGIIGQCPCPPMGDGRRWTPHIVAPIQVKEPLQALAAIRITSCCSEEDSRTINRVKNVARAIIEFGDKHCIGQAFLVVNAVASPAHPDSEIAQALRPIEWSLAEAMGKAAHERACKKHWLNKDGPRAEFLRGCEEQFEKELTPQLRSRLLLTYHKIYGSAEKLGEALFNSKSYGHYLRKGYKRPGRKQAKAFKSKDDSEVIDQEQKTQNEPTATLQEVVLPSASNRSRKKRRAKQVRAPAAGNTVQPEGQETVPDANLHHHGAVQYIMYASSWYTAEQYSYLMNAQGLETEFFQNPPQAFWCIECVI
jgi:hypothetical protein